MNKTDNSFEWTTYEWLEHLSDHKGRVPPNQRVVQGKFPVLHVGPVPEFDPETWDFRVEGCVEMTLKLSLGEFLKLPATVSVSDFHCVTGWSALDLKWEGVAFTTITNLVRPGDNARYVTIECDGGYTTSLPLQVLLENNVLLAYRLNDTPLTPEHGGPLRLVVPKKYAYKSAKWVRKIRFTEKQELGYWEKRGYSDSADPWKEERYT